MRLKNGSFKTEVDDGMFCISITDESDVSLDGGHTFEEVTNVFELSKQTAMDLFNELREYLGEM